MGWRMKGGSDFVFFFLVRGVFFGSTLGLSLSLSYIRTVVGYDKYSYFMSYGSNARYHGFMLDEI